MKRVLTALAVFTAGALTGTAAPALAAEGKAKEYKEIPWSWEGVFGGYDQAQLQRGYQVYREVCASCHSMKLIAFRHLGEKGAPYYLEQCPEELGLPETTDCSDPAQNPYVKAIAADYEITAGVDDSGDPLVRPGIPADYFPSPYANKQVAILANGGAYPPDQSLIVKSRLKGANYIYSLLTGYPDEVPQVLDVPAGSYYNPYYQGDTLSMFREEYVEEDHGETHPIEDRVRAVTPSELVTDGGLLYGGALKMAAPLRNGAVTYEDGTPATIEQQAKDVVAYLQWASEPKLEERKVMGQFVILYLFAFAGILYASYRQIWRNVEH